MKRLIILILSLACNQSFAQKGVGAINGFKYAYVEMLVYEDNQLDVYGVTQYLGNELTKKGLIMLNDNRANWPKDAEQNPCLIGHWYPNHSPGGIPNSANAGYVIKNCKDEIVYEQTGFSTRFGAFYPQNVPFAMKKAFKSMQELNYKFNEKLVPEIEFPNVESTSETEQSLRTYFNENRIEPIEGIYKSYQSDRLGYYKIGIKKRDDKFIAILIESDFKHWKQGEIKAYFETTSIRNIFSTKWLMGNKVSTETFSEIESKGILSIELENPQTEEKEFSKFIKLYPVSDNSTSSSKPSDNSDMKATGSGFAITVNGIIATNAHVIEGGENFQVSFSNELGNFTYQAKTLLKDVNNDIALLKIDDIKFKSFESIPYSIDEKTEIGESVFTIGYPLSSIMGDNYKVTNGIISANSGIDDDVRFLQVSVPLQAGNSGGPLFDKSGNIVGLTTAKLNSKAVGTSVENVNYAIKASYLLNVIKMVPDIPYETRKSYLTDRELKDQIKILKNYVCLIKVY